MQLDAIIPGSFNPEWNAQDGRKGRTKHDLGPDFTPLALGNDLLSWWDTKSLTSGNVTSWADRKGNRTLQPAGTGSPTFDGSMVVIPSTSWLYGANAGNGLTPPYEIWQVVDQQEAAGSGYKTSFATGSGNSLVQLEYTAAIGGQSSANVGGQTLFGGDDYHGIHVIRWQIAASGGQSIGWLDRKLGQPASVSAAAVVDPNSIFLGRDVQGLNAWVGRIGDTVVTKGGLSSGEVNAMWDFMVKRAGLSS